MDYAEKAAHLVARDPTVGENPWISPLAALAARGGWGWAAMVLTVLLLLGSLSISPLWAETRPPPVLPPPSLGEAGKPQPIPEVRVLIDISGSMKHTDPRTLRAPALRLLLGLLPQEAEGGVWFFGEEVEDVLKPGAVTEAWRKAARAAARISFNAPFTNIGAALEAALAGWEPAASQSVRRHVILLTDGMVDISKEEGANAKARQAILKTLLPRAQQLGVRLHTIALSAAADHDLLQTLARGTDGVYAYTDDAAELQRIFLRLFEKSAPRDALPLKDNVFTVDATVSQLTLLVFRRPKAAPTRILLPDGRAVAEAEAAKLPGWRWAREEGHDLITIDRPIPGRWRIEAASDPDNRALILSDLRLNSLPLPNTLYLGEQVDWAVWFSEKGELLKDERFHNTVSLKLIQGAVGETPRERFIADQGRGGDFVAGDGVINQRLGEGLRAGPQFLLLEASAKTFSRLIRHDFDVDSTELMQVHIETAGEGAARHYRVTATVDPSRVRAGEAMISGVLDCPPDPPVPVGLVAEEASFVLDLTPAQSGKACSLNLRLHGRLVNGRPINWPAPARPLAPLPSVVVTAAEVEQQDKNWVVIGGIVGSINVLAGLLAWGLLSLIRRRKQQQIADVLKGFATS